MQLFWDPKSPKPNKTSPVNTLYQSMETQSQLRLQAGSAQCKSSATRPGKKHSHPTQRKKRITRFSETESVCKQRHSSLSRLLPLYHFERNSSLRALLHCGIMLKMAHTQDQAKKHFFLSLAGFFAYVVTVFGIVRIRYPHMEIWHAMTWWHPVKSQIPTAVFMASILF